MENLNTSWVKLPALQGTTDKAQIAWAGKIRSEQVQWFVEQDPTENSKPKINQLFNTKQAQEVSFWLNERNFIGQAVMTTLVKEARREERIKNCQPIRAKA